MNELNQSSYYIFSFLYMYFAHFLDVQNVFVVFFYANIVKDRSITFLRSNNSFGNASTFLLLNV